MTAALQISVPDPQFHMIEDLSKVMDLPISRVGAKAITEWLERNYEHHMKFYGDANA